MRATCQKIPFFSFFCKFVLAVQTYQTVTRTELACAAGLTRGRARDYIDWMLGEWVMAAQKFFCACPSLLRRVQSVGAQLRAAALVRVVVCSK